MISEKANAICLLRILSEYSDENHILPMREILSKMNSEYGICPDRRTIYNSVAVLMDLGILRFLHMRKTALDIISNKDCLN